MTKSFTDKVYEIVKLIPSGKVSTYGDVAVLAGNPRASRAVGAAMSGNPDPHNIPCHRLVGSDGKLHGYAFGKGLETKRKLLVEEGVLMKDNRVDLINCRWEAKISNIDK